MTTADSESDNKSTSSPGKISIGDKETKVVSNQGKEVINFVKIVRYLTKFICIDLS